MSLWKRRAFAGVLDVSAQFRNASVLPVVDRCHGNTECLGCVLVTLSLTDNEFDGVLLVAGEKPECCLEDAIADRFVALMSLDGANLWITVAPYSFL